MSNDMINEGGAVYTSTEINKLKAKYRELARILNDLEIKGEDPTTDANGGSILGFTGRVWYDDESSMWVAE